MAIWLDSIENPVCHCETHHLCTLLIFPSEPFQGSVQMSLLHKDFSVFILTGTFFSPMTVHLPKPGWDGLAGSTAGSEIVPAVLVMALQLTLLPGLGPSLGSHVTCTCVCILLESGTVPQPFMSWLLLVAV